MNATFKMGWYVVYTKPRHEKKVLKDLDWMKVQNFLPTVKTLKIYAGKKRYVTLPLFPSYIFVKLEGMQQYFEILNIPGTLYFLKAGNLVALVRENIIQKIQYLAGLGSQDIEVSFEYFSPGTLINIHTGPLTGTCGEVVRHKGKNKLLVRIELLRRSLLVDRPSYCLEPIVATTISSNISQIC